MKQQYAFNVYGSQTSVEALNILKLKLVNNDYMKCVVITIMELTTEKVLYDNAD
jgi:hypothetical protein